MRRKLKKLKNKLSLTKTTGFISRDKFSFRSLADFLKSKKFWKGALLVFLLFLGMTLAVFGVFAKDLPDPNKINSRDVEQSTQILDRNGLLLYSVHGDKNRTLIALEDIPVNCRNAIIVKEDKDFYKHHGIVPRSIVRAFRANVFTFLGNNDKIEGGSTITQQLVKNVLLTPERTVSRKVKEVVLAIEIEQLYKKDDILKIYMNEIPFGSNAYGIQAAATTFYGKEAKSLNLEECAAIAALPQAPTYYSPYGQHKDELLRTKDFILDGMVSEGYIKKEEADAAKTRPVNFTPPRENILAPHFVLWVREALVALYGEKEVYEGGLKVTTTLDYGTQLKAEQAIRENLGNLAKARAQNASLVVMDPHTGQVLAMVGSKDYFDQSIDGNVNVSLTLQQAGSSAKPYTYATLFKQKDRFGRYWSPGSILYDVRTNFGSFGGKEYIPNNADGRDLHNSPGSPAGVITVRNALGNSLNIPAVRSQYIAGVGETIETMRDFGITSSNISESNCGLSLVLGGCDFTLLEHVNGYATFASMGVHHDIASVLKVEDASGKTIREFKDVSKRVIDPQITYLVADILSDPNARRPIFPASTFNIRGHRIAGKTGTSNEDVRNRAIDTWALSFNPDIAAGVWTGNNDNSYTTGTSVTAAEPIIKRFMQLALEGRPDKWYDRPAGIKGTTLDNITGGVPKGGATHNDIAASFFEAPDIEAGGTFTIDIVSGGRATSCTPEAAKLQQQSSKIVPEIGSNDEAYFRWADALKKIGGGAAAGPSFDDNVHKCSDDPPQASIADARRVGGTLFIKYNLTKGTHNIAGGSASGSSKVLFFVDGSQKAAISAPGESGCYIYSFPVVGAPAKSQITVFDSVLYSDSSNEKNINVAVSAPTC